MKPIFELDTLIKVNGVNVTAHIKAFCEQDDLSLDDIIGDLEDRPTLERKIERGDLMIGYVRVEATAVGCEGVDSIGGCYIESPDDINQVIADHGMVVNACSDLEKNIIEQAKTLKPFMGDV